MAEDDFAVLEFFRMISYDTQSASLVKVEFGFCHEKRSANSEVNISDSACELRRFG